MGEAVRDGNRVTSKLGANGTTPVTLKVENATGYLKAHIIHTHFAAPASIPAEAVQDANRVTSALGATVPTPLFVTNANGYLRAVNS